MKFSVKEEKQQKKQDFVIIWEESVFFVQHFLCHFTDFYRVAVY